MTDTLERTDLSVLEDFAPPCSLILKVMGVNIKRCENTAEWVGFTACCGREALVCQDHYDKRHVRPFICKCGKAHDDLIGWQRL